MQPRAKSSQRLRRLLRRQRRIIRRISQIAHASV